MADLTLDEAWRIVEDALPPGWVMQANIWRREDFGPTDRYARYTASAGPNEGPETAWLTGSGATPTGAFMALAIALRESSTPPHPGSDREGKEPSRNG